MIHLNFIRKSKKNIFYIVILFLTIGSYSQNNQRHNLLGKYKSNNGSEIDFNSKGQFKLYLKNILSDDEISNGYIEKKNNKYFLNSFDSLTSSYIYKKIELESNKDFTNDSIFIEILSPLTTEIKNKKFELNNWFCSNYPLRFIIFDDTWKFKKLFRSSTFKIPKNYKDELITSIDIIIVPDLLCIPKVRISQLWTETINFFDPQINHIKIYLPDLVVERFNYFKLKNEELKNINEFSFEFKGKTFIKL